MGIKDTFKKVWCQLIILSFWNIYWYIREMNARDQRALARRHRREAAEEVTVEPREENPVESDTDNEEISRGTRCRPITYPHSRS